MRWQKIKENSKKIGFIGLTVIVLVGIWPISPARTQTKKGTDQGAVTLTFVDPKGVAVDNATIEIYKAVSGTKPQLVTTAKTNGKGIVIFNLPAGEYLVAVKKSVITGNLAEQFSAVFYPLVSYLSVGRSATNVKLETIRFQLKNVKIVETEQFLQYYEKEEKYKKERLDEVPGHSGRVIKMVGAPVGTVEALFPASAVGARGIVLYDPTAIVLRGTETLRVKTLSYDGKVKNAHDVMLLGQSITNDGGNRILVENLQEKSGVEIPFEPMAHVFRDGITTFFMSNITFVSDEQNRPATLLYKYYYLDDPQYPYDLSAMISPVVLYSKGAGVNQ